MLRSSFRRCIEVPQTPSYTLEDCKVPAACLAEPVTADADVDSLVNVDIEVVQGSISAIYAHSTKSRSPTAGQTVCSLRGKLVWPTFVDVHTHIDKSHTCERSRNPTGSLSGADRSTDADALFWNSEDVYRRMDFSLKAAYAHGTSAVRTHLINMKPIQLELTWPTFAALRRKWAGKVELQGVALVALSFYRDAAAARDLADTVARHGGVLGACVCCAEIGGDPSDDWTTCERDRDELLDRIFALAKERDLDLDFHVDENGNEAAKGLLHVSQKALQHDYRGRTVCGHCCSLAAQPPRELDRILTAAREAGVTIVSLPLVNEWTQDRHLTGERTPRWRGVTLAHEIRAAGVPFAIASDNTRDQFYAYGDLDMVEVFTQGCRISHLDRPYSSWPAAVTSVPADAMRLPEHGRLRVGGPANLVVFRGRKFSEMLSRPQYDRVVIRNGAFLDAQPPDYSELDYVPSEFRYAAPRPLTPHASASLSRHNSQLINPLDRTASGPFTSFSQEQIKMGPPDALGVTPATQAVEEEVTRRLAEQPHAAQKGPQSSATAAWTALAVGIALSALAIAVLASALLAGRQVGCGQALASAAALEL